MASPASSMQGRSEDVLSREATPTRESLRFHAPTRHRSASPNEEDTVSRPVAGVLRRRRNVSAAVVTAGNGHSHQTTPAPFVNATPPRQRPRFRAPRRQRSASPNEEDLGVAPV